MTVALALCASLLWGSADFLGGTAARRLPATGVVLVSQAAALAGLVVVATATGAYGASIGYLGWALAAAVVGVVALVGFYAALATGTMGVVAPIAALGVVVPVAVGLAQGDRPSAWQAAELRSAEAGGGLRPLLAGVAAVGFGLVIVFVAHGARTSTTMTLLVMRATSVAVLGALAVGGMVAVRAGKRDLPMLIAVGAGDVLANAGLAVASTRGLLSVVAVLIASG
jgi:hypothetical protein